VCLVSRVFGRECSVAAGGTVGLLCICLYDLTNVDTRPIADRPFATTAGRNPDRYLKRIKDLPLVVSCFGLRVNYFIKDI